MKPIQFSYADVIKLYDYVGMTNPRVFESVVNLKHGSIAKFKQDVKKGVNQHLTVEQTAKISHHYLSFAMTIGILTKESYTVLKDYMNDPNKLKSDISATLTQAKVQQETIKSNTPPEPPKKVEKPVEPPKVKRPVGRPKKTVSEALKEVEPPKKEFRTIECREDDLRFVDDSPCEEPEVEEIDETEANWVTIEDLRSYILGESPLLEGQQDVPIEETLPRTTISDHILISLAQSLGYEVEL